VWVITEILQRTSGLKELEVKWEFPQALLDNPRSPFPWAVMLATRNENKIVTKLKEMTTLLRIRVVGHVPFTWPGLLNGAPATLTVQPQQ